MKFWDSLPAWTRGIIVLVIILALVAVFFAVKKYIKKPSDEKKEEKKASPAIAVKAAKTELAKLNASPNKNLRARLSKADYVKFADQLFTAMNGAGTNYETIRKVFENCRNRADVLSIIDAFGMRQLDVFGFKQGEPKNLIEALTDETANISAAAGLKKHNVYYQF